MAATAFMLECNMKWNNPLFHTSFPHRYFSIKPTNNLIKLYCKTSGFPKPLSSNLRLNCTFMNNASARYPHQSFITDEDDEIVNPFEAVARTVMEVLKALKTPAITGLLVGFLLLWDPNSAWAASGGRMGGNSFSSRRSSSSSSKSYSSPSHSTGGSSSSKSYSSPSYSSEESSESYSSPSYSTGGSSSSKSSSRGSSSLKSYSSSSSKSYSTEGSSESSYSSPTGRGSQGVSYKVADYDGGGDVYVGWLMAIFFFVIIGFVANTIIIIIMSTSSSHHKSDDGGVSTATGKTSVLKLQVGLLGTARSLQSDLNRIAETTDTSNSEGLSYVLTETALALLRNPDYCISCYSSVDVKINMDEGEKLFNQLSIEERGKFDEETLVNMNNIRKQSSSKKQRDKGISNNEYIVITILVAAEGVYKLPTINGSGDLKEALQKLGSIPSHTILAVEVLWTPQDENDMLTEREFLEDYSLLRPL